MNLTYQRKRIADFAAATKLARELAQRERWPRAQLARFQQTQLDELVQHAIANSPFYRERIDQRNTPIDLGELPNARQSDDDGSLRRRRN